MQLTAYPLCACAEPERPGKGIAAASTPGATGIPAGSPGATGTPKLPVPPAAASVCTSVNDWVDHIMAVASLGSGGYPFHNKALAPLITSPELLAQVLRDPRVHINAAGMKHGACVAAFKSEPESSPADREWAAANAKKWTERIRAASAPLNAKKLLLHIAAGLHRRGDVSVPRLHALIDALRPNPDLCFGVDRHLWLTVRATDLATAPQVRGKSRGKYRGESRDRSRSKSRGASRGKSRGRSRGKSRGKSPSKHRGRSASEAPVLAATTAAAPASTDGSEASDPHGVAPTGISWALPDSELRGASPIAAFLLIPTTLTKLSLRVCAGASVCSYLAVLCTVSVYYCHCSSCRSRVSVCPASASTGSGLGPATCIRGGPASDSFGRHV